MECQECIEQEEMLTEAQERIDELTMQVRDYSQIFCDQIQATADERDEAQEENTTLRTALEDLIAAASRAHASWMDEIQEGDHEANMMDLDRAIAKAKERTNQ